MAPKQVLPQKQFLAGWEVSLDNNEHCQSFIETQLTDQETAENRYSHIILNYDEDGLLVYAEKKDEDGNSDELVVKSDQIRFNVLRINRVYNFSQNDNGENWIGGSVPVDFKIPENSCPGSFQYLGKLSNKSKAFDWLPFEINLICPIYLDLDKLWLDYSAPNSPQILNLEEINSLTTAYDDLKSDSFIEYEKVPFSTYESKEIDYDLGFAGLPNWIQYPDIPRCPKSNKTMRFLCQLLSDDSVLTKSTNIEPEQDSYRQYFDKMNFWGDGDLFVFFEPTSKIACFMIQNT